MVKARRLGMVSKKLATQEAGLTGKNQARARLPTQMAASTKEASSKISVTAPANSPSPTRSRSTMAPGKTTSSLAAELLSCPMTKASLANSPTTRSWWGNSLRKRILLQAEVLASFRLRLFSRQVSSLLLAEVVNSGGTTMQTATNGRSWMMAKWETTTSSPFTARSGWQIQANISSKPQAQGLSIAEIAK